MASIIILGRLLLRMAILIVAAVNKSSYIAALAGLGTADAALARERVVLFLLRALLCVASVPLRHCGDAFYSLL